MLTEGLGELKLQSEIENQGDKEKNAQHICARKANLMHILLMHILTEIKAFVLFCVHKCPSACLIFLSYDASFILKTKQNLGKTKNSRAYTNLS